MHPKRMCIPGSTLRLMQWLTTKNHFHLWYYWVWFGTISQLTHRTHRTHTLAHPLHILLGWDMEPGVPWVFGDSHNRQRLRTYMTQRQWQKLERRSEWRRLFGPFLHPRLLPPWFLGKTRGDDQIAWHLDMGANHSEVIMTVWDMCILHFNMVDLWSQKMAQNGTKPLDGKTVTANDNNNRDNSTSTRHFSFWPDEMFYSETWGSL